MREYHTYSIEMKMSMVREYLQGNIGQRDFALQRGINFHTFNSWVTKYNKSRANRLPLSVIPAPHTDAVAIVPHEEMNHERKTKGKKQKTYIRIKVKGISLEINPDDVSELLEALSHD
jgi:transposase-like protein